MSDQFFSVLPIMILSPIINQKCIRYEKNGLFVFRICCHDTGC